MGKIVNPKKYLWISRVLIGIVVFLNLSIGAFNLLTYRGYTHGMVFYQPNELTWILSRTIGVFVIIWQIPYIISLINPLKNILSIVESVYPKIST